MLHYQQTEKMTFGVRPILIENMKRMEHGLFVVIVKISWKESKIMVQLIYEGMLKGSTLIQNEEDKKMSGYIGQQILKMGVKKMEIMN